MKHLFKKISFIALAFIFSLAAYVPVNQQVVTPTTVVAQTVASNDYYSDIDMSLNGKAFRAQVAELITDTQKINSSYDNLRNVFKKSDADPNVSGNILWFYSGTSVAFTGAFTNTNREHVWPKNAGSAFPASSECGSDAHHLRPANNNLNSSRSNNNFGEVPQINGSIVSEGGSTTYKNLCYQSNQVFYPGKTYRGATARVLMYVQTRWGDQFELKFVLGKGNNKTIGDIEDLLKWHYEEPPTQVEILRNDYLYSYQGNRNPFIDHPEYATKIYCYDGESYNSTLQKVAEQYDKYDGSQIVTANSISVPETIELDIGKTQQIKPVAFPSNATCSYEYTVKDTRIATIDANGLVTAHKDGTTTITVKETYSNLSKTITVKVTDPAAANIINFRESLERAKNSMNGSCELALESISQALRVYNNLTAEEQESVYDEYHTLLALIETYNQKVKEHNDSQDNADKNGLFPFKGN